MRAPSTNDDLIDRTEPADVVQWVPGKAEEVRSSSDLERTAAGVDQPGALHRHREQRIAGLQPSRYQEICLFLHSPAVRVEGRAGVGSDRQVFGTSSGDLGRGPLVGDMGEDLRQGLRGCRFLLVGAHEAFGGNQGAHQGACPEPGQKSVIEVGEVLDRVDTSCERILESGPAMGVNSHPEASGMSTAGHLGKVIGRHLDGVRCTARGDYASGGEELHHLAAGISDRVHGDEEVPSGDGMPGEEVAVTGGMADGDSGDDVRCRSRRKGVVRGHRQHYVLRRTEIPHGGDSAGNLLTSVVRHESSELRSAHSLGRTRDIVATVEAKVYVGIDQTGNADLAMSSSGWWDAPAQLGDHPVAHPYPDPFHRFETRSHQSQVESP